MQVETELFGTLSVEETNDYDNATQVNRACWYISAPGKRNAWVLLKPPEDGSNLYQFATGATLLNNVCTKTGRTVEHAVKPDEALRAVATWGDDYVVFLGKPAKDGATILLVPKSVVREVRDKK